MDDGANGRRPNLSAATQAGRDERERRLAAAMRDNLKRRKAQERGRSAAEPAKPAAPEARRDDDT